MKETKLTCIWKKFSAALLGLLLLSALCGAAYAEETGPRPNAPEEFLYVLAGDHVEIGCYIGDKQTVVIPETIEGLPVTVVRLGNYNTESIPGFYPYVKKVVLPKTVVKLDDYCFSRLSMLCEIEGLEYVRELGEGVFNETTSLKTIHFSNNLKKASMYAFSGSYMGMESLWLPDDLDWEPYSFNCESFPSLSEMVLFPGETEATLMIRERMLFTADGKKLYAILPYMKDAVCIVPEGTESIFTYAFYATMYTTDIQLPDSVIDFEPAWIDQSLMFYVNAGSYAEMALREYIGQNPDSAPRLCVIGKDTRESVSDIVAEVIAQTLREGMTDYQKARALHDWILDHAEYDYSLSRFDAIDLFLQGSGVCDAYTKAYSMLLEAAGIESRRIECTLEGDPHAINAIRLEDKWYLVDCTNDDEGFGMGEWLFCFDRVIFEKNYGGDLTLDCDDISLYAPYYSGTLDECLANVRNLIRERLLAGGEDYFTVTPVNPVDSLSADAVCSVLMKDSWEKGGKTVTIRCDASDSGIFMISVNAAETLQVPYFYDVTDTGICLTAYRGKDSVVRVPSEIAGVTVTALSETFRDNQDITQVILPDTIAEIGIEAFSNCCNLESVNMPSALKEIGEYAFLNCYSLQGRVALPEGLETLGKFAFAGCAGMTSVTVPGSVRNIGAGVFARCEVLEDVRLSQGITKIVDDMFFGCSRLECLILPDTVTSIGGGAFVSTALRALRIPKNVSSIEWSALSEADLSGTATFEQLTVDPANPYYTAKGSVLYSKDGKTLIMAVGKTNSDFYIPEGVTAIADYAFAGSQTIKSVHMPSSMRTIGKGAFFLSSLSNVYMEKGVRIIGDYAFAGYGGLSFSPSDLLSIGSSGSSLMYIELPDTIESIGEGAFLGNNSLRTLAIPDSVTEIPYQIINYPQSLILPPSVTYMAEQTMVEDWGENIVYGMSGSYAEQYAAQYGYSFVPLESPFALTAGKTELLPFEETLITPLSLDPADASPLSEDVEWEVIPSELGDMHGNVFRACAPGDATVIAKAGNRRAECTLHIYNLTEEDEIEFRISDYDNASVIWYGQTAQLQPSVTVYETLADGSSDYVYLYLVDCCTFIVSDPNVVELFANGYFKAIGKGETDVTAVLPGGRQCTRHITVAGSPMPDKNNAEMLLTQASTLVRLPSSAMREIGSEAFAGARFEAVWIPEGCTAVGAQAFADNPYMIAAVLPSSLTEIDDTAFTGCDKLTLIVCSESAIDYAERNGIPYIVD